MANVTYCKAKSKRTGVHCKARAMSNGYCYHHGGATPTGLALPHTKTGRYSKHLPTRLLATYEAGLADANLLELKDQVSLIDARLVEQISGLDTEVNANSWRKLAAAFGDLRSSMRANDPQKIGKALGELGSLIDSGKRDADAWQDIYTTVELRRKLSETERKALLQAEQSITAEQAMLMIAAITDVIRQNVADRATLQAISTGINRIITVEPG